MKRELIAKDKEIETLKISIEKRDNIIEDLKRQFDNKCIEMIHLRKAHYEKLKKIKSFCQNLIDEYDSLPDLVLESGRADEFFSWTDFDKIIKIIDGEKK